MEYIELEPSEFKLHLQEHENKILLDVREEYEYEDDNVGGINMPMATVLSRMNDLKDNTLIFVLCKSGKRSKAISYHLSKQLKNCKVYTCNGGIEAYKQLND